MTMLSETTLESPFGRLFLAIQQQIKEKVPAIRWIDLDVNQLENYNGDRPPVAWPCLLIDFPDCNYEDAGEALQEGDVIVQLRLGFPPISATNANTPILYRDKALANLEVENQVYKALHGQKLDNFGYLMRTKVKTEGREGDAIRVRDMRYTLNFFDKNAMVEYQHAKPGDMNFAGEWNWP